MDSTEMSLFGTEYSLFSGDLLGFPSSVLNEDEVVIGPQDGLKSTTDQPAIWQVEDIALGQVLNSTSFNADPLEDWLDTRIDLLDLLEDVVPTEADSTQTTNILPNVQSGLDALKSVALETTLELALETTLELSAEVEKDSPVSKISGLEENPYSTGMGLMDLLTSSVAAFVEPIAQSIDLDVAQDSCILSPMSPEDVESILSSGPASPAAHEESIEMLFGSLSATDNSFELGQSLLVENDTADNIPADLALLSQMVASENEVITAQDISVDSGVGSDDSTLSDIDVEYHVNKSRKTPYTRGTKKDKKSQQDKQVERKQRKKQQNKDAATRYRQKKKAESDRVGQDSAELEQKNTKLREKVEQMTNEVQYLKNLLTDVYKARGMKCK